jgi:hypothetical protein
MQKIKLTLDLTGFGICDTVNLESKSRQNEGELTMRDKRTEKALEVLRLVRGDCEQALSGEWDRSDEGFQAMLYNCIEVLEMPHSKYVLVYQAGIANVFRVDSLNLSDYGREARRLYQGSFGGAVDFALGIGVTGATVRTAHCNEAGDIAQRQWSEDLNSAPFREGLIEVKVN